MPKCTEMQLAFYSPTQESETKMCRPREADRTTRWSGRIPRVRVDRDRCHGVCARLRRADSYL